MKQARLSLCPPAVLLAACADSGANHTPILDGTATAAFQSDLSACQALARDERRFDREAAGATVLGAGAGALMGAADDDGGAAGGAIAGAVAGGVAGALAGAVAGAVNASERRDAIVVECLRGRGHRVVG